MKLFNNNSEDFLSYIEQPLFNKGVELELIFGSSPKENPINKKIFLDLINRCKENYSLMEELTTLDIRCEYKRNVSNIRCSVHGLDSIKKYCKTDSLDDIEDLEFIQKQYYKNNDDPSKKYLSLKDYDYNVRLNIKTEKTLDKNHRFVTSFLHNFQDKKKHFRYKKRLSFLTNDKLFKIDITVIKATRYFKGNYDFQKTFRGANVLKNFETYEVEIEYIGWKDEVGEEEIDRLYKHFNETYISNPGKETLGNIYDPLNMGIPLFEDKPFSIEDEMDYDYDYGADGGGFLPESEGTFDYIDSYDYESPRMTDEQNVQESENIVKYQELIGKYVKIKDKYFLDNNIDLKVVASLKEYYKKGIYFGIVKSVSEDEGNINAYVEFNEPIGGIPSLFVPVNQLYNIPSFTPLQS